MPLTAVDNLFMMHQEGTRCYSALFPVKKIGRCTQRSGVYHNERRGGASSSGIQKIVERVQLIVPVPQRDAPRTYMARKDSEKDSERPHYYSQFWLDVAAGRRIIGAPKTNEEGDLEQEPEVPVLHKPIHSVSSSDGYHETIAHPEVEPDLDVETEVYTEPELDEEELDAGEEEMPPLDVDETEIPDMDFAPLEEEEEEEETFYDEEEEEEEEEDIGWTGRGRKKPKPGRQTKLPQKKPSKRDTRRGF